MNPFDFHPRTRIVFGPGTVAALGELADELGAARALVVSDPGIVAAGHADLGIAAIERAGIQTLLFDGVAENPTTEHVEAGSAAARRFEPDLLVGLGGGSSMDCAKGINFLYTNGGRMQDYWGIGKATRPMLPVDRRPDHGRHRERSPIVRFDIRPADARQNGLRRQEGGVSRGPARPGS